MIAVDAALRESVTAFYAYETMLLDENRLREWLNLLDDDIRYVMPMRETHFGPPDERRAPTFYLFNDDKKSLESRIARLETGMALVDSPPAATQRLVTDVLVLGREAGLTSVRSSFMVLHVRDERNETLFAGHRVDQLVIDSPAIRVRRRDIQLAHYVLPRAVSTFF